MSTQTLGNDANLVAMWLRKDPKRWTAGLLAGLLAGVVALAFGMLLALVGGEDLWMPVKYLGLPVLGNAALEYGFIFKHILVGFIVFEVLAAFFGALYAHFTGTNALTPLLGVGLAWGAFSWIFLYCLYTPSFRDVFVAQVSAGAGFAVCMVYGIALTSVSFFDRMLR